MNHRSFQTLTPSVWLLWLLWGSIVTDRSWMIDDLRKYEIRSDGGGGFKDRWWQGNKTQRRRTDSRSAADSNVSLDCADFDDMQSFCWKPLKKTFIWDNFQHQLWVQEVAAHLSALFEDFMVCCHRTKCVGGWVPVSVTSIRGSVELELFILPLRAAL